MKLTCRSTQHYILLYVLIRRGSWRADNCGYFFRNEIGSVQERLTNLVSISNRDEFHKRKPSLIIATKKRVKRVH